MIKISTIYWPRLRNYWMTHPSYELCYSRYSCFSVFFFLLLLFPAFLSGHHLLTVPSLKMIWKTKSFTFSSVFNFYLFFPDQTHSSFVSKLTWVIWSSFEHKAGDQIKLSLNKMWTMDISIPQIKYGFCDQKTNSI